MNRLPNAENAFVDLRKITDYLLDPTHHRGRHKARVFRASFGIGKDDAEWLRNKLLDAAKKEETSFLFTDEFGTRYQIDFTLIGLDREVTIRSAWIIRHGETFPRFTGCYIL